MSKTSFIASAVQTNWHSAMVWERKIYVNLSSLKTIYIKHILPGIMQASPKVMSPILLCWPTVSEADVGGLAVEVQMVVTVPENSWE